MQAFVREYLRLLDIDPAGNFLRLINRSHERALDLRRVRIQQVDGDGRVCNCYAFDEQSASLLGSDVVVTIYSRDYRRLKFDIRPYVFVANELARWLTDDYVRTELSLDGIVFDSRARQALTNDDVPYLFIQHASHTRQRDVQIKTFSPWMEAFHFPYCSSPDNAVNPHTRGQGRRRRQHEVTCFEDYPRRLTTVPRAPPR